MKDQYVEVRGTIYKIIDEKPGWIFIKAKQIYDIRCSRHKSKCCPFPERRKEFGCHKVNSPYDCFESLGTIKEIPKLRGLLELGE